MRGALAGGLSVWMALAALATAGEVTVEKDEHGAVIQIDGQPFAHYVTDFGPQPIIWPIVGPTGKKMTRAYPMAKEPAGEKQDHPWHRSLWFTHGDVNGIDFWANHGKGNGAKIAHREFVELKSGPQGVLVTRNDWLDAQGKKVLEDERRFTFGGDKNARWIDAEITLKANAGAVTFGDTKEGSFGMRVASSMDVDAKQGGKLVNSRGQENGATWAQPAEWVDYHGPVDGETVGIAIMYHPSSFRFPTRWHVRTYGLFAANPFGSRNFPDKDAPDGAHELKSGESLKLRYRVLLHKGDTREGQVAKAYAEFKE